VAKKDAIGNPNTVKFRALHRSSSKKEFIPKIIFLHPISILYPSGSVPSLASRGTLQIKNCKSRIANQELQIKNCKSRIANQELQIKNCKSRIANQELQIQELQVKNGKSTKKSLLDSLDK
jgi:hypothetical protein